MVLTGRKINGTTAGEWGLVSRVVKEAESVVEEAVKVAEQIAGFSAIAVQAGKEAVNEGELDNVQALSHFPRHIVPEQIFWPVLMSLVSSRAPSGSRSTVRAQALPQSVCNERQSRG